MGEPTEDHSSLERARNAAIEWLESNGVTFGPRRKVTIGRLETSLGKGKEIGTESNEGTYWKIRIDYDDTKKAHFNAEVGKGAKRKKRAFKFPASESEMKSIFKKRHPR